jgi:hypothetical protein
MELLVLIDQGVGLIKGFSVRVGGNRRVDYAKRWGMDFPRSGSVLWKKLSYALLRLR